MIKQKKLFLALVALAILVFLVLIALVVSRLTTIAEIDNLAAPTAVIDTAIPVYVHPVPAAYTKPILDSIGWSLRRESVRENSGVRYIDFLTVSSGRFYTLTLPIDGNPIVDVLDAYMPLKTGVVSIPIPIGIASAQQYRYFDAGRDVAEAISRENALADARQRMPRGQVINLTMFRYISLGGADWQKCADQEEKEVVAQTCRDAASFSRIAPPNAERMFISKILTDGRWLPIGWWFMVYLPDTVTLPEE